MFTLLATLTKQELEKIYELTYKYGWIVSEERQQGQLSDRAYMEKARIEGELSSLLEKALQDTWWAYAYWLEEHRKFLYNYPEYTEEDKLVKIIRNAEKLYEELGQSKTFNLNDQIILFQKALNFSHYNDIMVGNIVQTDTIKGISPYDLLDQLSSDKYVSKWNKELQQSTGIRVGASLHLKSALILMQSFV